VGDGGDLVVDASVGVKFFLEEEGSAAARAVFALLEDRESPILHVPDLFFVECANALRKAVLHRALDPAEALQEVEALEGLSVESSTLRHLAADAFTIAAESSVSVYDAAYVVLSDRTGAPLVTADRRLFDKLRGTRHRVRWLGEFAPR
jgi:predicted nucleic acid-binding protein